MKKTFLTLSVVLMMICNSCSEEADIAPQIEDLESSMSVILAEAPECNTTPIDWDGMRVDLRNQFSLRLNGSFDSQTWTSSNESVISFRSNTTSNSVSLFANRLGSSTICVTANRNNSTGTCASCGTITVVSIPPCRPPTAIRINQLTINNACEGEIFTFIADPNGSTDNGTYQWSAFNGASVVSGQGTNRVRIQSPSSGGFSVSVDHVNACRNTSVSGFNLALFNADCGGGFGPF